MLAVAAIHLVLDTWTPARRRPAPALKVVRTPDRTAWMLAFRSNAARGDTHAQLFRQGVLQVMR
jgi:hypothetical protein